MHTLNPSSGLWPPALGRRATGPAASPDPYSKSHKLELVPAPNVSSCPTSQRPLSVKDLTSVNLTLLLWKAKLGQEILDLTAEQGGNNCTESRERFKWNFQETPFSITMEFCLLDKTLERRHTNSECCGLSAHLAIKSRAPKPISVT